MATSFSPSFAAIPQSIQSMFGDVQARTKSSMETGAKVAEEMGAFTKGNMEALLTSTRVAAKGVEALGRDAAAYSKKNVETVSAAFKEIAAAKSPTELFKIQSDYAKSSFDGAVAEGARLSETWLKLVGEIVQPLSNRAAVAADKIKAPKL